MLTRKQVFYIFVLLIIMIFSGLLELIAIASVLPFISLITQPEILDNDNYFLIKYILNIFNVNNDNVINLFATIFSSLTKPIFTALYKFSNNLLS